MRPNTALALAVMMTLFASTLEAQSTPTPQAGTPAKSTATAVSRGPLPFALQSPEVHPDRTVIFRLRAPQATAVEPVGEVMQGKTSQPMTKDSEGVWSITIGPLPPEIWIYNFRIEGIDFPDPANISLMPRSAGSVAVSSFVEVPGDTPRPFTMRVRCRMDKSA
jgi:hypothetical protein